MSDPQIASLADTERLRRWRLILGGGPADGTDCALQGRDQAMDRALEALYDGERRGGLGGSAPSVARWLGDIRGFFPASVVRVMQQDALERLDLRRMLLEPELLESVIPDVHMVGTLLSLSGVMPQRAKDTARMMVRRVVEELTRKLAAPGSSARCLPRCPPSPRAWSSLTPPWLI